MKIILGQKLFDLDEVSKMIGVGKTTLRKYIKDKSLQTTTIERRKYLSEDEIKRMILPTPQTDKK